MIRLPNTGITNAPALHFDGAPSTSCDALVHVAVLCAQTATALSVTLPELPGVHGTSAVCGRAYVPCVEVTLPQVFPASTENGEVIGVLKASQLAEPPL